MQSRRGLEKVAMVIIRNRRKLWTDSARTSVVPSAGKFDIPPSQEILLSVDNDNLVVLFIVSGRKLSKVNNV